MFFLTCAHLVISALIIRRMTLVTGNVNNSIVNVDDLIDKMELHIADENHPFNEPLHMTYVENLKDLKKNSLLLVHDEYGNLDKSTYHYLALRVHDMYEVFSSFMTNKMMRPYSSELTEDSLFYLTHRNLVRHTINQFGLEFYMTLLYKSRQEALEKLTQHYPRHTRRNIIECQQARNEFDRQFRTVLTQLRTLLSQLMVFAEKTFYWNTKVGDEEYEEEAGSKKEKGRLKNVERHQQFLSSHLEEVQNLLKIKKLFYLTHMLSHKYLHNQLGKEEASSDNESGDKDHQDI